MADTFWRRWWEEATLGARAELRSNVRRSLTNADHMGWQEAADIREATPPPIRTIEDARARVKAANPVRWFYLKRDYKWAQREMKKLGLNPEDARWLL